MSLFIKLTHTKSGERMYLRADQIIQVRCKEGKTLVVTPERGMYVNETPEEVISMAGKAIKTFDPFNLRGGTSEHNDMYQPPDVQYGDIYQDSMPIDTVRLPQHDISPGGETT